MAAAETAGVWVGCGAVEQKVREVSSRDVASHEDSSRRIEGLHPKLETRQVLRRSRGCASAAVSTSMLWVSIRFCCIILAHPT